MKCGRLAHFPKNWKTKTESVSHQHHVKKLQSNEPVNYLIDLSSDEEAYPYLLVLKKITIPISYIL